MLFRNGFPLMIKRELKIDLPKKQSAFLWGARKTGKTTLLKEVFSEGLFIDLLKSDVYFKYLKSPFLLREELLAFDKKNQDRVVIIDEVQKVPLLLDEVHWLIENTDFQFILCGSSARKLRQKGVNLLGGRAWKFHFFPLVFNEILNFDLLKALNHGLIPSHYLSHHPKRFLKSYVEDYLIQEIKAEGLVRNLASFARFLEAASFSNAEMVNYTNIARDCGVDAKTVKEYFQILKDTLIGYEIDPYRKKGKRDIIQSTPKFYFFDPGVSNYISKTSLAALKGHDAGKSFETYLFHELNAYKNIREKDYDITYWRTQTGLEIDFIINDGHVIIEAKISDHVSKTDLKGMIAFMDDHSVSKAIVVCNELTLRKITFSDDKCIYIYPYVTFLKELWNDKIL
ncbi:MAG: hypothetical protein CNLJKLNK_01428 [Holosporales bacterium]